MEFESSTTLLNIKHHKIVFSLKIIYIDISILLIVTNKIIKLF